MHSTSFTRKGLFFIAAAFMLFQVSCHAPNNTALSNQDDNSGYASDVSRVERCTDDVISIADAAASTYNGAYLRTTSGSTLGTCATVATDTIDPVHTLVIRFGPTDCTCQDGRKRRGTIIVTYTGEYTDTAKVHTITFDNYFVNEVQMLGSIQTNRVDTTIVGDWYYKVLVNDSLNMGTGNTNAQYVSWQGNLVHKWISGYGTIDRNDDMYSISGSATLVRPNGHQFYIAISSPLQVAVNCDYVEAGVIDVTGYLTPERVVNYGDPTAANCDNQAQLTIGSSPYSITLAP